jgi:hypothetical protein
LLAAVIGLYFVVLLCLSLLGVERLALTIRACLADDRAAPPAVELPRLVVQLPIYNEALVVERALRAAAALRYPKDQLEIQVLDDSTDDTRVIVQRIATELGLVVVRRSDRRGYKAGALANGLLHTDAELVAIFDADFVPGPDFLERIVPALLEDPRCGMVQARWSHLDPGARWLTRAQAIFLDAHFAIEHRARDAAGLFFNFNGTAGVWRRSAIILAGGWRGDTLTEDLDLSYRAQLAGVRFRYLDRVDSPAELPASWDAFRAQQARWVRGSLETARLLLGPVLRADRSLSVRLDAAAHLLANLAYPLLLLLAILLPMTVVLRDLASWRVPGGRELLSLLDLGSLGGGTIVVLIYFAGAQLRLGKGLGPLKALEIIWATCIGAGLSVGNSVAVLQAVLQKPGEFERTPKQGEARLEAALERYRPRSGLRLALVELFLGVYAIAGLGFAIHTGLWGATPFLAMYAIGFVAIGTGTLLELQRAPEPVAITSS